jgi:hypothetical protein
MQAFLEHLMAQRNRMPNSPPILFINCREVGVIGPEAISKAICAALTSPSVLSQLSNFPDAVKRILEGSVFPSPKISVGNISVNLEKFVEYIKKDENDFEKTLKKLYMVLTALDSLPLKPVIIIGTLQNLRLCFFTAFYLFIFENVVGVPLELILPPIFHLADEANNLMKWNEQDKKEPQPKRMLDFLVAISKQNNQVHVLLVTSDYFLVNWLKGSKLQFFYCLIPFL